jgi:hypothetical protein
MRGKVPSNDCVHVRIHAVFGFFKTHNMGEESNLTVKTKH